MKFLRDNDSNDEHNIVRIKDYIVFRKHLCITFELLSINLYEFIKNNEFKGVSLGLIRRFAIQILQALLYTEKYSIIHCDLKPENILLCNPKRSAVRIVDFGSGEEEQSRAQLLGKLPREVEGHASEVGVAEKFVEIV